MEIENAKRELGASALFLSTSRSGWLSGQCLVEHVQRKPELAFDPVDSTTKCATLSIFILPSHLLSQPFSSSSSSPSSSGSSTSVPVSVSPEVHSLDDQMERKKNNRSKRSLVGWLGELVEECKSGQGSQCLETMEDTRSPKEEVGAESGTSIEPEAGKERSYLERVSERLDKLYKGFRVSHDETTVHSLLEEGPCTRSKPNWIPLFAVLEKSNAIFVLLAPTPQTLDAMIKFNYHTLRPAVLATSTPPRIGEVQTRETDADTPLRFVLFQLFHAVGSLHDCGLAHSSLTPLHVHVRSDLWIFLDPPFPPLPLSPSIPSADMEASMVAGLTEMWRTHRLSNLEYLMAINRAAGRSMSDASFHPIIPWVTDFTSQDLENTSATHWRDLRKSKYRLTKGDDQLDITFNNSPTPHHITESLSEITFYIYMARVTPLATLKNVVRSSFEAKEYPASMKRMFEWTPDECIPEFFLDPSVFCSTHTSIQMPDLKYPSWCTDERDFISWHRRALESSYVSSQLHHWIDLNFGYKLSGRAAVDAKNVTLPLSSLPSHRARKSPGFVQVFTTPHPPRESPVPVTNPASSFERACTFDAKFSHILEPVYSFHHPGVEKVSTEKEDDVFAMGCITAELYLREPIFDADRITRYRSTGNLRQAAPETLKLPPRARALVHDLLHVDPHCRPSLKECLEPERYSNLFPPYFEHVYQFLAEYHGRFTWLSRVALIRERLVEALERVCPEQRREAVLLLKPTLLDLISKGCDETRAQTPVLLLQLLAPYIDVAEHFLGFVTQTYEDMQNRGQWGLLRYAIRPLSVLHVLYACGTMSFMNHYLPIVRDTVLSTKAPRVVRDEAAYALLSLGQNGGLGIGLSVNAILEPMLDRWESLKLRCYLELENVCQYAHYHHFCARRSDTLKLRTCKVARMVDKLHAVLVDNQKGGKANLILPVQNPIVRVIRYITTSSGRRTTLKRVLPRTFGVFENLLQQQEDLSQCLASPKWCSALLDTIALLTSLLSNLVADDIQEWFLSPTSRGFPLLQQLVQGFQADLLPSSSSPSHQMLVLYTSLLLSLVTSRSGSHSTTTVIEMGRPILVKVASDDLSSTCSTELWSARIILMPFLASLGLDKFKRLHPGLLPSRIEPHIEYPFSRDQDRRDAREDDCSRLDQQEEDEEAEEEEGVQVEKVSDDEEAGFVFNGATNPFPDDVAGTKKRPSFVGKEDSEEKDSEDLVFEYLTSTEESNAKGTALVALSLDDRTTEPNGAENNSGTALGDALPRSPSRRNERSASTSFLTNSSSQENAMEDAWLLRDNQSRSLFSAGDRSGGGKVLHTFKAHAHPIVTMDVSSDDMFLATSCRANMVRLWSLAGRGPKVVSEFTNRRQVSGIRLLDRGGKCLLLDGAVRIWDTEREEITSIPVDIAHRPILTVQTAPFQPRGAENVLYAATVAGTVDVMDVRVKKSTVASHALPYVPAGSRRESFDPRGLPSGSLAAGGSYVNGWVAAARPSGYISIVDMRMGTVQAHWRAHEGAVVSVFPVAISEQHGHSSISCQGSDPVRWKGFLNGLVSLSAEGSARLWDLDQHGGLENSTVVPMMDSLRRPVCRSRAVGFPSVMRYSKISAPARRLSPLGLYMDIMDAKVVAKEKVPSGNQPLTRISSLTMSTMGEELKHSRDFQTEPSVSPLRSRSMSADESLFGSSLPNLIGSVGEWATGAAAAAAGGGGGGGGGEDAVEHRKDNLVDEEEPPPSSGRRSPAFSGMAIDEVDALPIRQKALEAVATRSTSISSSGGPMFADLGVYPPSPSKGGSKGNVGRSFNRYGRVTISIPQCDTAALCETGRGDGVCLVMGADNQLVSSQLLLEQKRDSQVSVSAISDRGSLDVASEKLRINVLRSVPTRGLLLVGSETGHVHTVHL